MKVVLDANILGRGFGAVATRTGIFRATEHFVRAMLRRDDVALSFSADSSWVAELQLLAYDRARGAGLGGQVLRVWSQEGAGDREGTELIARILADEEGGRDARRDRATLMLLNATARRLPPPAQFDILHSLRTALPPKARLDARARVLTVHDVIPLLHPEWMYRGAEAEFRAIVDSVDVGRDFIIANSEATAGDVCTVLAMPRERVFVTPFAAAPDIFRPERSASRQEEVRTRYGIPEGPYLLSLCTLEPRKNLPHLMRAFFRLVDQERPEGLRLVLVGPTGWNVEEIFATIARRPDLRARVHFPGFVLDADLAALYSGARAFVYPSLYEGFGLPVLEAMQCGTPVITSNTSSLPEVAGDSADYVPPTDEDALCEALRRVVTDDRWAADMGRRGLERAGRFSWERTAEETVAAYHLML